MPRPKQYATAAERQAAYKLRNEARRLPLTELLEALIQAFDAAGCSKIVDDLDLDNPDAAALLLATRLTGRRLVAFKLE